MGGREGRGCDEQATVGRQMMRHEGGQFCARRVEALTSANSGFMMSTPCFPFLTCETWSMYLENRLSRSRLRARVDKRASTVSVERLIENAV